MVCWMVVRRWFAPCVAALCSLATVLSEPESSLRRAASSRNRVSTAAFSPCFATSEARCVVRFTAVECNVSRSCRAAASVSPSATIARSVSAIEGDQALVGDGDAVRVA